MQTRFSANFFAKLAAAMFVSLLCATAHSQFFYTTNNDTLAITGYFGPGGEITIPDSIGGLPVTSIADAAFQDQTTLNVVTIPNSVTNIGVGAFEGCEWIFGVNLPTNITSIADKTFYQCQQLVGVDIPNSVTNIGTNAFYSCLSLREMTIPDSVKNIADYAFAGCWRLGQLSIGNGVGNIGYGAFAGCTALTNLSLGNSITNIGDWGFSGCSALSMVILPKSLKNIGDFGFEAGPKLRAIYFLGDAPTNLSTHLYPLPINNAPLYYLPGTTGWSSTIQDHPTVLWNPQVDMDGASRLGPNGFGFRVIGSSNLLVMVEAASNLLNADWLPVSTNLLADGAANVLDSDSIHYPSRYYRLSPTAPSDYDFIVTNDTLTLTQFYGAGGDVVIPSEIGGLPVVCIGQAAFLNNENLVTLSIPDSVTNIETNAFANCTNLVSVTIGSRTVGAESFANCASLTNIVLTTNVASIETGAFDFSGLTSIEIPGSVTNIGTGAFDTCLALTDINVDAANPIYSSANGVLFDKTGTVLIECPRNKSSYAIPSGTLRIDDKAFQYCSALTNVTFPNSLADIGDDAFSFCVGLTNIVLPGVTNVGNDAFASCFNLNSVISGNSLLEIRSNAFGACAHLTHLAIPHVVEIDESAFASCQDLTNVAFPNSLTTIGNSAFNYCTGLTNIVLPGITNIGSAAFASCFNVTNLILGTNLLEIQSNAFLNCSSVTHLAIPNSVVDIGQLAFASCSSLSNLTIGLNVRQIGSSAFAGCGLTNVLLPASVTNVAEDAFGSSPMQAIDVAPLNPVYSSIDGVVFDSTRTTLFIFPWAREGSYSIPEGVTKIADDAFQHSPINNISMPSSLVEIGTNAFIDTWFTNLSIPDGVKRIDADAFDYCHARNISIGNGVTNIDAGAFAGCSATNILVGKNVEHLGAVAFGYSFVLQTVYFTGNAPSADEDVFEDDGNMIIYYQAGTTGWGQYFADRKTTLWQP